MSKIASHLKRLSENHLDCGPQTVVRPFKRAAPGQVTLVDTHVHTRYSDGRASVREVESLCADHRVGCMITDHNEIRGSMKLFERDRVPTLPSIEVGSREKMELLVYFRRSDQCEDYFRTEVEPYRSRRWFAYLPRDLDYLLRGALERGAVVCVPHPFAPLWKNLEYGWRRAGAVHRALTAANCIEVINGGLPKRANRKAFALCERLDRVPLGGSDAHSLDQIGSVLVAFNGPVTSEGLFEQIKDDDVYGVLSQNGRPKYLSQSWQLVSRHSKKLILPSREPWLD
jgi:predicted metal-dependent phosphoesterase TrpH